MVRRWVAEMSAEGLSASRVKQARADTYAGPFEDDLEALADRLDERLSVTIVAPTLPEDGAEVTEFQRKAV